MSAAHQRACLGSPLNGPKQWQGVKAANRSVMAATLLAAAVAKTAGFLVFELPSQLALVSGQLPALRPRLALGHLMLHPEAHTISVRRQQPPASAVWSNDIVVLNLPRLAASLSSMPLFVEPGCSPTLDSGSAPGRAFGRRCPCPIGSGSTQLSSLLLAAIAGFVQTLQAALAGL